ncbi:MAG TPA: ATP-dependent Clp protease adaptor ClpS [Bacteroidales bacterium]|jgi:ATP-dependent Clp protease adaptor protein ClpS|nr:ATP-dependent Clp protease adaptor ClpS [Bacteroidales bacterium]HNR43148.1 ATP-dependent Clp protease adaptor ClpS [Bacteroidales bacterium]HQG77638.1 ATP-dependent Clp protease adaptor ClpS [Bacteroidales bacterium]
MKERILRKSGKMQGSDDKFSLVLFNDEINTFDHVIRSLVEVCGHDEVQAEQCALIVHLKGSCEIKSGIREVLEVMSKSLNAKGLNSRVVNS